MKVALVWNQPGSEAEEGVLLRREVPLLRLLAEQGVSATVILLAGRPSLAAALRNAGVATRSLPVALPAAASSMARIPGVALRLRPVLAQLDADVVEGDDTFPAIAAGLACLHLGRGVVAYRRHFYSARPRGLAASWMAARLAHVTIVSNEATRRKAASDHGTSPDRIEVAASGADEPPAPSAERIAALRRTLSIGASARVVGVVSRLRREKGIDVLLAALPLLSDIPELHVVIAGDGPEMEPLRRLAHGGPVPVHFLGHRQDAGEWIAASDLIAVPSRLESFGRVTVEAMAAGRPLVASGVGGLPGAVADGVTGRLVPPDDPAALAAALRELLTDRAAARRMGEAGRARYQERHTLPHMAAAWRCAWERALRRGGAGRR